MKLYEINEALTQLFDPETGEITDGITPAHAGKRLRHPKKIGTVPTECINFHSVWKR